MTGVPVIAPRASRVGRWCARVLVVLGATAFGVFLSWLIAGAGASAGQSEADTAQAEHDSAIEVVRSFPDGAALTGHASRAAAWVTQSVIDTADRQRERLAQRSATSLSSAGSDGLTAAATELGAIPELGRRILSEPLLRHAPAPAHHRQGVGDSDSKGSAADARTQARCAEYGPGDPTPPRLSVRTGSSTDLEPAGLPGRSEVDGPGRAPVPGTPPLVPAAGSGGSPACALFSGMAGSPATSRICAEPVSRYAVPCCPRDPSAQPGVTPD